jgi:hypothetical protein
VFVPLELRWWCLPSVLATFAVAAGFTPAKLAPRTSVTGPALPSCGAGSTRVFCPVGVPFSAVMTV